MKVGQNSVIRWISKLGAASARSDRNLPAGQLQQLNAEQLRQVCGGVGASTATPTKGW
jgi:hypothetical protein